MSWSILERPSLPRRILQAVKSSTDNQLMNRQHDKEHLSTVNQSSFGESLIRPNVTEPKKQQKMNFFLFIGGESAPIRERRRSRS